MENKRPDVIKLLENERMYYLEQIKRIDIALAALRGERITIEEGNSILVSSKPVPWVSAIENVFQSTDKWLTIKDVQNKLCENGIPEALDKRKKPIIYSTLIRKVKNEFLERNEDGLYRKKGESNIRALEL